MMMLTQLATSIYGTDDLTHLIEVPLDDKHPSDLLRMFRDACRSNPPSLRVIINGKEYLHDYRKDYPSTLTGRLFRCQAHAAYRKKIEAITGESYL